MAMTPTDVADLVAELLPEWQAERQRLDRIDRWARWEHDAPHQPKQATREYRELAKRAQAPWGDLVVSSIAQTLYVEGYRRPDAPEDSTGWTIWQANGMDGRQVALHRAALTYGYAFEAVLPGRTLTGEPMPVMRGHSPREMQAYYDDITDEWPVVALRVTKQRGRVLYEVFDDEAIYTGTAKSMDDKPSFPPDLVKLHDAGVVPVVRFKNRFDLEGRSAGEIEPFIPILGSIDQTKFDRLVVQRFASWVVRTVAGMSVPETAKAAGVDQSTVEMRLKVNDLLIAEDPDAKFGSLPATPLDGFIKAHEADLTDLAATSQTPAFELLGQMANMSAEALAAAKASQTAKSEERKHTLGEDHEQAIRLACHIAGDIEGANDFQSQVRWEDTTIRSLAQAVDALGKMATMLGFPPELLWAKVPGFTQQDIDEARERLNEGGGIEAMLRELAAGQTSVNDGDFA